MGKHRIVKNLLIMAAGQAVTWTVSIGHLVLVSRYLGPVRLGEFVLASSITTVLGLLLGLGMDTYIVRAIARTPERGNVIITAALLVRGSLALLIPISVYMYAHLVHLNAETSDAAYILGVGTVMAQLSGVLVATFQGHERMSFGAIGNVLFNCAQLGLTVLVIIMNTGVIAFAVNNALLASLVLALNAWWARKFVRLTRQVTVGDIRAVVTGSFAFCAGNLFQTFYASIDSVILGALAGNRPVAFYGAANRLAGIPMVLPQVLGQATLPVLSRLGIDPGRDFEQASRKTLALLITASIPLVVGVATFAGPGIRIIFGESFSSAIPALTILSLCIPFTFIDMQCYQILAAHNQEGRWTLIMGICCAINPLINLLLIPVAVSHWHNGAIGAALALLATEALMTVYGAVILRRIVLHPLVGRAIVGALAGGVAQVAFLRLVGAPPLAVMLLAEAFAAGLYTVIAISLRALPPQDVLFLWNTVRRRSQQPAAA
jgi:O-antigen/teichoic acid export membrane protein